MQTEKRTLEELLQSSRRYRRLGSYHEAYALAMRALALCDGKGADVAVPDRSRALLNASRTAYYCSRFEESLSLLGTFDLLAAASGGAVEGCFVYEAALVRANISRRRGQFREALEILASCTGVDERACRPVLPAEKRLIEGACLFYLAEIAEAEKRLEAALGFAAQEDDSSVRARVLTMLGFVAQSKGLLESAAEYFSRARELSAAIEDRYGEAAACLNMGIVLYRRGRFDEAERNIVRAKAVFETIGWRLGFCRTLLALGNVRKLKRAYGPALDAYREALRLAATDGFERERALAYEYMGDVFCERGTPARAQRLFADALACAGRIAPEGDITVETHRRLGELHLSQGNIGRALPHLRTGIRLAHRLGERLELGILLRSFGVAGFLAGRGERGRKLFARAISMLRSSGFDFELAKTHVMFAELLVGASVTLPGASAGAAIDTSLSSRISGDRSADLDAAWRSAVEAGHLLGEIDCDFWRERADALIDRIMLERGRCRSVQTVNRESGRIIKIAFSPEYLMGDRFVAVSQAMLRLREQIRFAARLQRPVLVTGETGTGKELVASLVHRESNRAERPFIALNCAAIPDHLFESEFFGHRRGCFTGALADRRGLFEEANGGTLFLDEVGELTTLQQVKLLRVLQEAKVRRLGENVERSIDVRIISATNQDIESKLESSSFREDFYYRINAEQIHVPPLRERLEDVVPLIAYYLCTNENGGHGECRIELAALKCLQRYTWPGNIRELFAVLERVKHLADGNPINLDMLPDRIGRDARDPRAAFALKNGNAGSGNGPKVKKALELCRGNKSAAARWLGISRGTLYKELRRAGLAE